MVQDSARLGAMGLPGMGFTRASCRAKQNQKGVPPSDATCAGSNQAGEMVT